MNIQPAQNLPAGRILVSPSVLAADFSALGDELQRVEKGGADLIHLDVMDGHFVPNLTIGPALIASLRKKCTIPFDVHLMITNPLRYVEAFAKAGADHITFHIEADDDPVKTIEAIHNAGLSAGITLKPGTPASALKPVIGMVEMVLIMTVEPGFGGQSFMADQVAKAAEIRQMLAEAGHTAHIEADGGVNDENAVMLAKAGVNILVAGTSVFRHPQGAAFAIDGLHQASQYLPCNA